MPLLSVRMRASLRGKHVSGAERIVEEELLPQVLCELIRRPPEHDLMVLTVERVESVEFIDTSLPVSSFEFGSVEEAREFALKKLAESDVPYEVARMGLELLKRGANPRGGNMRGAVLLDVESGERLEPDPERGIRTVRVDWLRREEVKRKLLERGFTERTLDALAIASKNVHCGVLAELCWSDDPLYLTGYVASKKLGYVRITPMKLREDPLGGRVYFIRREEKGKVVDCLEKRAILIRSLHPS